jgi:outer membrane protein insertion porin family
MTTFVQFFCRITSGPLSGLIGSFAYSHRNLFGRNQKLNVSLERGQIDSIFRINYTDPWIEGDDKRTSRSIMVQVTPLLVISMRLLR